MKIKSKHFLAVSNYDSLSCSWFRRSCDHNIVTENIVTTSPCISDAKIPAKLFQVDPYTWSGRENSLVIFIKQLIVHYSFQRRNVKKIYGLYPMFTSLNEFFNNLIPRCRMRLNFSMLYNRFLWAFFVS